MFLRMEKMQLVDLMCFTSFSIDFNGTHNVIVLSVHKMQNFFNNDCLLQSFTICVHSICKCQSSCKYSSTDSLSFIARTSNSLWSAYNWASLTLVEPWYFIQVESQISFVVSRTRIVFIIEQSMDWKR
jgi:hypothetical protein